MANFTTFQIVDPDAVSTVLFDLNDLTGATTPGGVVTTVRELRLRTPQPEVVEFAPPSADGGSTTFVREPLVTTEWNQLLIGSSHVNIQTAGRELLRLLRLGGTIRMQSSSAAAVQLIDFERGGIAGALFGEALEDQFRALTSFAYPSGIPIAIRRQPALRGLELDSDANKLTNATLLLDQTGTANRPDDWTWADVASISAESIAAALEAFQFTCAASLTRDLFQTTGAATAANGDTFTLSFQARQVSGTTAQAAARLTYKSAADVNLTASPQVLTNLTSAWQTLTVTFQATNAATDRVQAALELVTGGGSATVAFRNAKLEKASAATNFIAESRAVPSDPTSSGGQVLPVYIGGNAPAPVVFEVTADTGAKLQELLIADLWHEGIDGHRSLADHTNATKFGQCESSGNGWTATLYNGTASVADASASGGNAAETNATTNDLLRLGRYVRTTLLDSLRGDWEVYVRVSLRGTDPWNLQLRWGLGQPDPVPEVRDAVAYSITGSTYAYEYVRLGSVSVPEDLPLAGLSLELWGQLAVGGTGTPIRWDHFVFVGADRQGVIVVPASSEEVTLGKDLATPVTSPAGGTAGDVSGTGLKLVESTDNCGVSPNAGGAWPAGRHRVTFVLSGKEATIGSGSGKGAAGLIAIRNVTDSADAASAAVSVTGLEERTLDVDVGVAPNQAGDAFQAQVASGATTTLTVLSVRRTHIPYVGASEKMRSDPQAGTSKLDSSGNFLVTLAGRGVVPMWLEPGLHMLHVLAVEIPVVGHPNGESVLTRAPTIRHRFYPRSYQ